LSWPRLLKFKTRPFFASSSTSFNLENTELESPCTKTNPRRAFLELNSRPSSRIFLGVIISTTSGIFLFYQKTAFSAIEIIIADFGGNKNPFKVGMGKFDKIRYLEYSTLPAIICSLEEI